MSYDRSQTAGKLLLVVPPRIRVSPDDSHGAGEERGLLRQHDRADRSAQPERDNDRERRQHRPTIGLRPAGRAWAVPGAVRQGGDRPGPECRLEALAALPER